MLAEGIGCCIHMVVRRAAPSSLRMIIRSSVEDARVLDNGGLQWARAPSDPLKARVMGILLLVSPTSW